MNAKRIKTHWKLILKWSKVDGTNVDNSCYKCKLRREGMDAMRVVFMVDEAHKEGNWQWLRDSGHPHLSCDLHLTPQLSQ